MPTTPVCTCCTKPPPDPLAECKEKLETAQRLALEFKSQVESVVALCAEHSITSGYFHERLAKLRDKLTTKLEIDRMHDRVEITNVQREQIARLEKQVAQAIGLHDQNLKLAEENYALRSKVKQLESDLADARQTIEDVACGTRLDCPKCGKLQPCLCQNTP